MVEKKHKLFSRKEFLSTLILTLLFASTTAAFCNTDYAYEQAMFINLTTFQNNYTAIINITNTSGHTQGDFSDIVFYNATNCARLPTVLGSYNNGTNALFLVNVTANGTGFGGASTNLTLFIDWGNKTNVPLVNETEVTKVLTNMADDFSAATLDTSKWRSLGTGVCYQANGQLTGNADSRCKWNKFNDNGSLTFTWLSYQTPTTSNKYFGIAEAPDAGFNYVAIWQNTSYCSNTWYNRYLMNGTDVCRTASTALFNSWHLYEVSVKPGAYVLFWEDGVNTLNLSYVVNASAPNFTFGFNADSAANSSNFSFVGARPFVDKEAIITYGAFSTVPSAGVTLDAPASGTNYTTNSVTVNYTPTNFLNGIRNATLFGTFLGAWGQNSSNTTTIVQSATNQITVSNLPQGYYLWNIGVHNGTQYVFATSNKSFIIDLVNPAITLSSPANEGRITGSSTNFSATISDAFGIKNISLYTNATGTWHVNATNTSGIPNASNTITFLTQNLPIPQGIVWNMRVCDTAGNCVFASNNFTTYTDQPPNVTLSSPANGATLTPPVSVYFVPTDDHALQNASLYWNNSGKWAYYSTITSLTNASSSGFTINTPVLTTTVWNVLVCDDLGQCAFATNNRTFVINATFNAQIFDETTNTQINYWNLTISNSTTTIIFSNISSTLNISTNTIPNGAVTITIANGSYARSRTYSITIPNSGTNFTGFLLNAPTSQNVNIKVENENFVGLVGASVTVEKMVGSRWVLIDDGTTGSDGITSFYLDTTTQYSFNASYGLLSKNNTLITPTSTDYQIILYSSTNASYASLFNLTKFKLAPDAVTSNYTNFSWTVTTNNASIAWFAFQVWRNGAIYYTENSTTTTGGVIWENLTTNNLSVTNLTIVGYIYAPGYDLFQYNRTIQVYTIQNTGLKGGLDALKGLGAPVTLLLLAIIFTLCVAGFFVVKTGPMTGGWVALIVMGGFALLGWVNTAHYAIGAFAFFALVAFRYGIIR